VTPFRLLYPKASPAGGLATTQDICFIRAISGGSISEPLPSRIVVAPTSVPRRTGIDDDPHVLSFAVFRFSVRSFV